VSCTGLSFRGHFHPAPAFGFTSRAAELLKRSGHRVRMHEEPLGHIADARNKRSWIDGSRGNSNVTWATICS